MFARVACASIIRHVDQHMVVHACGRKLDLDDDDDLRSAIFDRVGPAKLSGFHDSISEGKPRASIALATSLISSPVHSPSGLPFGMTTSSIRPSSAAASSRAINSLASDRVIFIAIPDTSEPQVATLRLECLALPFHVKGAGR
jgi:hypothetical protein